ncbi:MAG: metalloregulator ArsR/SmtB family transcription factor [Pseudomonadota bacterium]
MENSLDDVVQRFRAAAEPTRLRILALLSHGDLAVGEMVNVLGLSQPRLSHQLKILANAGLVSRLPEGSWVFYRAARRGACAEVIQLALAQADLSRGDFARDANQLSAIQSRRASDAARYFDSMAETWDTVRGLHFSNQAIEDALLAAVGPGPFRQAIDVGTGTGRILTLLSPRADRVEGLDLSHQMLTVARDNLQRQGTTNASVRYGDACAMPFEDGAADLMVLHQLLHFIDQPDRVLQEVRRVLAPGGTLAIVDFAPHTVEFLRSEHGHRRLGIADSALAEWAAGTGMVPEPVRRFNPPDDRPNGLAVCIWIAQAPGAVTALAKEAAA